jgi:hypothetical protein
MHVRVDGAWQHPAVTGIDQLSALWLRVSGEDARDPAIIDR